MSKSGLYINGNKACDVHKDSIIKIIPSHFSINQGNTMFKNNFHGAVFHGSTVIVDGVQFDIKEFSNNQEVIQIEIFGSVQSLKATNSSLTVKAENIGKVKNMNGNIKIQANSVGSASTANGNVYSIKE